MSVKECIKNARYRLGMNQKEFAEFVNLSKASISLYETGDRKPGFPAIRKIVEQLKLRNIELNYSDLRDDN